MSDLSARLALPYLAPAQAQAQKHVTHNEALARLDLLVQLAVESFGAEAPPGAGWVFVAPRPGWIALGLADGRLRRFDGSAWEAVVPATDNLEGVGIGTASDAVNRLAVVAPATLLSHAGAGHQLKLNKAAAADTASLLFQTGWSGHAEMGTSGTDDFAIKLSADGSAWTDALVLHAATGAVSGAAVQGSATDTGPGKLALAQHAYGPDNLVGTVSEAAWPTARRSCRPPAP